MHENPEVARILEAFYAVLDEGGEADADATCRAHPEHAEALRAHFTALALLDEALGVLPAEEGEDRLGEYRLGAELGSGGMGTVYFARCEGRTAGLEPGDPVALKVVHPHLLEAAGFFKRFLREAEVGKAVRHPNVVRTYDADAILARGIYHHFLVMEYVEGQTLRALLGELGPLPEELCLHVAGEIAKGLTAIHAAGVVHRDIKPENVLITASQDVKIMDLGVARLADVALRLSQGGASSARCTMRHRSSSMMAAVSSSVDGRADLFALGVMLYELSSGEHPHAGDDMPHVLRRIREEKPRRLGGLNPQLSPFFEELVHTLLEKDPADRFASAAALASAIQEGTSSEWWQGRASALQHATRRPLRRVRIPRETALYGRNHELDRLDELYERAAAGEGHVAWIEGEAGIGKTRLLDEFAERLAVRGAEASVLYGSFPPGGAATGTGAFAAAFHDHLGVSGSAPYLRDAPLLVPAFDALLRGEGPPPTWIR